MGKALLCPTAALFADAAGDPGRILQRLATTVLLLRALTAEDDVHDDDDDEDDEDAAAAAAFGAAWAALSANVRSRPTTVRFAETRRRVATRAVHAALS